MAPSSSRPLALVTGGRRGIGRAIAARLAETGFDLALTDLQADETVAEDLRVHGAGVLLVASDLADLAEHERTIEAVVERFGRIDCLVNNAGIASPVRGDLLALSAADFDRVIAVNLRGTLFFTQAVARRMLELGESGGHDRSIITISSANAEMATVERGDYSISKAGLSMLTKLFALRLAGAGIAVFEVRPGLIRTDMTTVVRERYARMIADGVVPLGRWGEAGDVADVVAGLASGAFRFATGSVIAADGGLAIPRF